MVRRSTPPGKLDERAFPVRVKLRNPIVGPDFIRWTDAEVWLSEQLGAGEYAHHAQPGFDCHTMAFYFRSLDAAQRFLDAFPAYELADGTSSLEHIRNARRSVAGRNEAEGTSPASGHRRSNI